MLEIGKNTYCSLEEAEIIARRLLPLGSAFEYWRALTSEQQESLLIESVEDIERLPVAGAKVYHNQPLQFPRYSNFYNSIEIPKEVIEAQVLNAVDKMLSELGTSVSEGKILTSLRAENKLRRWTCGGFKMGGIRW